jgi:GNAT superfamily N-acetyltransferase
MSVPSVEVFTVRGAAIGPFIPDAARLRIAVFRDWPYLYEGDDVYERDYLRTYRDNPDSLFVIARAGGEVIGLSTGIPLQAETGEVKAPFLAEGINPATVFYFGESVLLPDWRGRGLGVRFFEERERYARSLPGIRHAAFCAVEYVPLDSFWAKRGFAKTALRTGFTWQEIGEAEASLKQLTFWMKAIL